MVAITSHERQLEEELIEKLCRDLKYEHRPDIRDRTTLEANFREKFQVLNHVRLTDGEFQRLLKEIIKRDVFTAAQTLRNRNSFTRDGGTPLNYILVNISDWCKNDFGSHQPFVWRTLKHNEFLEELGLSPLPSTESRPSRTYEIKVGARRNARRDYAASLQK